MHHNIMHGYLVHRSHSDAHGPLEMGVDQVVQQGDDCNYQEVVDTRHQIYTYNAIHAM